MVRSLYSGISGLRNHQVALDVSGNNIANVNTVGYKAERITFEESMAQLLRGATRPPGNTGGTNPMQIGLGMSIAAIDTVLTQGNLQSTGQITDLAIEGRSYFTYSNGDGNYFSRNGALQMDATGKLVSPTNGFVLQGMMAQQDGSYPTGSVIGDIRIPYGEKAPAKATTEVGFSCNLDSDSDGLGSVVHTNRYLASGRSTLANPVQPLENATLSSLYDDNGHSLGIHERDIITITATDGNTNTVLSDDLKVEKATTLEDLRQSVENVLVNIDPNISVAIQQDGTLQINMDPAAAGTKVTNLSVRTNRPGSNSYVTNLFSWGPSLTNAAPPGDQFTSTGAVRRPATADDLLSEVYDASGNTLGLEDETATGGVADEIRINGAVGGSPIASAPIAYSNTMTMGDLLLHIQQAFNLPERDGTDQNNLSVSLNSADTPDDRIPDGAITIRGQKEKAFALTNLSIVGLNEDNDQTAPLRFTANNSFVELQAARDTGVHSTSIEVYDESGDSHIMTTTFTHSGHPGEWLWEITTAGGEEIIGGNTGRITFGQDGSPSSFTFDDQSTSFRFNPMNGSNEVGIKLDIGSPGSFQGITQFRSPSTVAARDQDGYPMGKLQEISIDEFGEITGIYTNGVGKSIAQIYVAEFNNPAGLMRIGDSMYTTSNNSGDAVLLKPGEGSTSRIKPGALEMSNVDLASEFTNMITTQRGYQANARVITTSDQMLQELVQLIR